MASTRYYVSTKYTDEWMIFYCRMIIGLGFLSVVRRKGVVVPKLTLQFACSAISAMRDPTLQKTLGNIVMLEEGYFATKNNYLKNFDDRTVIANAVCMATFLHTRSTSVFGEFSLEPWKIKGLKLLKVLGCYPAASSKPSIKRGPGKFCSWRVLLGFGYKTQKSTLRCLVSI